MIYVLKKTISVSFLSEISAVRKDRFTLLRRVGAIQNRDLPLSIRKSVKNIKKC